METLDILLCAGNSRLSRIIQRANRIDGYKGEAAEISHVATALKVDALEAFRLFDTKKHNLYQHNICDNRYVFESTTINKWADKSGVQLNEFDSWLKNYDGKVYLRQLACTPPGGVAEWMASQVGRPYENGLGGILELLTVYIPLSWYRGRTIEAHCSEIDAECLQYFGLMRKVNPSKLPPAMWFGERLDDIMNCRVNKPERLK